MPWVAEKRSIRLVGQSSYTNELLGGTILQEFEDEVAYIRTATDRGHACLVQLELTNWDMKKTKSLLPKRSTVPKQVCGILL